MKRIIASLFVAAFALCTSSEAAPAPEVEIIPDVVYGHKAGMALTFDVIKPKEKARGSAMIKARLGAVVALRPLRPRSAGGLSHAEAWVFPTRCAAGRGAIRRRATSSTIRF
jgi:hypothetical protein